MQTKLTAATHLNLLMGEHAWSSDVLLDDFCFEMGIIDLCEGPMSNLQQAALIHGVLNLLVELIIKWHSVIR